jgi:hypothetical protein
MHEPGTFVIYTDDVGCLGLHRAIDMLDAAHFVGRMRLKRCEYVLMEGTPVLTPRRGMDTSELDMVFLDEEEAVEETVEETADEDRYCRLIPDFFEL